MAHGRDSRLSNFGYGVVAGTILALLVCGAAYALNVKDPPLAPNLETAKAFVAFVSWKWFFGIVGGVALIGFIFNVKLVYTLTDLIHWFD